MATRDARARPGNPWSASAHGLVGRDTELGTIRDLLSDGRRVVTVLGVAGAGKTSLLSAAARSAADAGWVAVRVQGRASETMLGFAVLLDLLDSHVADDVETGALAVAIREHILGDTEGRTPEALWLRRAVHQWLLGLAGETNLLVLVDDVPWVDPASWAVLAFVANRLRESQVSFLLASRGESTEGIDDQPVLHLSPLGLTDATALLDRSGPSLIPSSARRSSR